jgi:hypothetical protein
MKKLAFVLLGIIFFIFSTKGVAANDNDTIKKFQEPEEVTHKVFATIFASYYSGNSKVVPKSAFEMPTALLGYTASFSNKLKATLIYDVTRTSSNFTINNGTTNLEINYFEGSKYTAYLKMAEIMYSVNDFIDFRIGQLLNTQYLTTQDKFWGYRYIYFTFQEVHRFGNPADFGAQIDFKYGDKILNQVSVTNGEGPFRHQDLNGKFLYSNNLELRPIKGLILKLYTDYSPVSDDLTDTEDKYAISAFVGYKAEQFKAAIEYNKVYNYGYKSNNGFYGFSTFGSYSLNSKVDLLARYDYINKSTVMDLDKGHFVLAGIQFKLHKNLNFSVNYRLLNPVEKQWIYSSFGVSF